MGVITTFAITAIITYCCYNRRNCYDYHYAGKEPTFNNEQTKEKKQFYIEKPHHWVQKCHSMPKSDANSGHVLNVQAEQWTSLDVMLILRNEKIQFYRQ